MVREDILGGLRVALSKGHSLQNAMQSFYNSGYKKEDIEEAARYLQSHNFYFSNKSLYLCLYFYVKKHMCLENILGYMVLF